MVGSISHDLRGPVNGIMILLDVAMKVVPKECQNLIEPAILNCNHLMCLINDILDFTQEEFDQVQHMYFEKVDLKQEIRQLSQSFKMKAEIR